jgi:AbrB family looped-hinge helix DNA binding protein
MNVINIHLPSYQICTLPVIKYYYLSITHLPEIIMRVTSKGQVTIPRNVRESMGIRPAETEIEFLQDENGRWYIAKAQPRHKKASRFRTAHKTGKLTMSTDDIMALTRGEAWPSS